MGSAPRRGRDEKGHRERTDEPIKLTTTTHVSVDRVMQGAAGRVRTAGADSSAADGRWECSTTR
jgi:hypothetical protein